jgi:hypothetical protein
MQAIEAYPLCWPVGYKRTPQYSQQHARFDTSFAIVRDRIMKELKLLGAKDPIMSTNVPVRQDGLPYASFKAIQDTGVAIYFTYNGDQMVFCCDKWKKVEDNLQAICKTINAFRMMPQWGVSDMLKRAFTGFKALPAQEVNRSWFEVLGVSENSGEYEIKDAYRRLATQLHPDKPGGSEIRMQAINAAYEEAMKKFKKHY